MKKHIFLFAAAMSVATAANAQNVNQNVNQNTTVIHNFPITERVVEKPVYIEKYRTVYVDRPQPARVAKKLAAPLVLHGYLYVYTEDIGNFKSQRDALEIIGNINRQAPFGRNDWRIPTSAELTVMEQNAAAVGLGDDIYIATDHANGVLRMVSTGPTVAEQRAEAASVAAAEEAAAAEKRASGAVLVAGTWWATRNVGEAGTFVANPQDYGQLYKYHDASNACPEGWRLPTRAEIENLARAKIEVKTQINGINGYRFGTGNNSIFLPAAGEKTSKGLQYRNEHGTYWTSTLTDKFGYYCILELTSLVYAYGGAGSECELSVRCVLR